MGLDAQRVYVDTRVSDVDAAARAADVASRHWGMGAPRLVRAGMNAIYAVGDVVLRVGSPTVPASASIELAEFLHDRGVAVPLPERRDVVTCGELSVTAWERIEPVAGLSRQATLGDWSALGALVRRLHRIDPADLPRAVPVPRPSALPWWHFDTLLERVAPSLDQQAYDGLLAAIERHRGWEDFTDVVGCHGDVHPGNVIMAAGGPVLLDWDLLCLAPPGWDHGPLLTLHERWGGPAGVYDAFAAGYGQTLIHDPSTVAFAELRLVAATLMRVIVAVDEPGAREEAQRRLRYWRGEVAAPTWRAQ